MKKLISLPLLLFAAMFMAMYVMDVQAAQAPAPATGAAAPRTLAAPACSGYYGTMKATNWPGGKLTLTCPGKSRPRGLCVGNSAQLSPGQGFSFNNCNCLDPKSKCLTVSGLPPGCKVKGTLACGANRETVDGSFEVTCAADSPTASGSASPSPCVSPSQPAMGTSLAPSFVCLGLGEVGGCLTPTVNPGTDPCVSPVPSDIFPSTIAPSGIVPSDGFISAPPDVTFVPSDAVPSDGFVPAP